MKKHFLNKTAIILSAGLLSITSFAADVDIKLNARVRGEATENAGFEDVGENSKISSRFRIDMTVDADESTQIFIQPQFSETWGAAPVLVADGVLPAAVKPGPATLIDGNAAIHQAYITHSFKERYSIRAGRQEINFGDQLLVGAVGWHGVSRTFNAIKLNSKFSVVDLDLFTAKTQENGTALDEDFYGVYARMGYGENFKNIDLYHLVKSNTAADMETASTGLRVKSKVGERFDYRVEVTSQQMNSNSESQADAEVGFIAMPSRNLRVSAEYFTASKGYDQLYPTGHKWLGFADQFMRKNISGFKVAAGGDLLEGVRAYVMYHQFTRTNADDANHAYQFNGKAFGVNDSSGAGTSDDVGSEIDLVVGTKLSDSLKLSAGFSQFTPGQYLKDVDKGESGTFGFIQLLASY